MNLKDKLSICAITTTRADYGIMRPLLLKLNQAEWADLKVAVTGTHLLASFGMTIGEIEKDELPIDAKIMILDGENHSPNDTASIMSKTITGFTKYFTDSKPDVVLLLGDRFETFVVASSAVICQIPVIHIAGGETTEGAIDEVFRHSITKMSYLHLASCSDYAKRIIQLGEEPKRVFNTGALGVENVLHVKRLSKEELSKSLNFTLDKPYAVVTFHPVTLEKDSAIRELNELLSVLARHTEMKFIITKANADQGGEAINAALDEFVLHHDNCAVYPSLGMLRYFSAISYAECVIGNSSSGIVEVPSFKIPTINIGDRQRGRLQASSVINCLPEDKEIEEALEKALSSKYRKIASETVNPYGGENSSDKMMDAIYNTFILGDTDLKKKFYDVNFEVNK